MVNGGSVLLDPLRRSLATLARDAFERRQGFELIEENGIPALWDSFVPKMSERDAKALCRTYYLDLIRHIYGYSSLVRRDSIRNERVLLLSKVEGPTISRPIGGDLSLRKDCVHAAKSIQRELLRSHGWVKAKGGRFELEVAGDTLFVTFDYGTYRSWAVFDLRVASIRLRLAPSVLFCVDIDRYMAYAPEEIFSKRFANAMELVSFFGSRLRTVIDARSSGA